MEEKQVPVQTIVQDAQYVALRELMARALHLQAYSDEY